MASSKRITHDQIAEEGVIKDHLQKEFEDLVKFLPEVEEALDSVAKKVMADFKNVKIVNLKDLETLSELTKRVEELEAANAKLKETKKKLSDEEIARHQINRDAQKERVALLKAEEIELGKQAGTLKKLEAANTRLRIERSKLNTETAEGRKRLIEINKELDKNNKYIKDNSDQLKRQKLNVGNYKESIKEALNETGLFDTQIGKLIVTLGDLKKKFEENAKESGKFTNGLKLGAAGGIAIAVAALKGLASVNSAIAEGFEKAGAQLVGFITGGLKGAKAAAAFKDALFASYEILRNYGLELQKVSLDEGDFVDIANDTTIGFKERNAALQESIRLSQERARINLAIAQNELDIINKQVAAESIGLRKASPELLDKQAEAQKKLNEALDAQSDLLRENAQLNRKLSEERTTMQIDLLLKTKQSANARKVILEQQIADEKVQLETRKKAAEELLEVNNTTTNEQIAIFKKGFNVEFDGNSLLSEQNAIALKQKIEAIQFLDENNNMVGIGVEAQKTLAEIVAKYQKENLEYAATKKKLDEEEIKLMQRIKQLQGETEVLKLQDDVNDLEQEFEKLDEAIEKNFEKLLDNPFSRKLQKRRELQLQILKQQAEDLFNSQVELLEKKAELDIQNINNTITDEKLKAEEIKKINTQLQIDLGNLQGKALAQSTEIKDLELKQEKELYKKKLSTVLDATQQITAGIADGLQKRADMQLAADQQSIDQHQRTVDVQTALAAAGKENVLAEELAASAKAEEKKLQDAKKAAKQQETIALIDTFTKTLQAGLNSGDPFIKAFGEALASEGLVSAAFSKLFAGFYEGTEAVKSTDGLNIGTSRDSQLVRVNTGERILGVEDSANIPAGMTNKDVVAASQMYMNPELKSTFFPVVNESALQQNNYDTKIYELANEFRAMRKAFESKPVHQSNLGRLGEWTDSIRRENVNTIIHHKNSTKRPSLRLNG